MCPLFGGSTDHTHLQHIVHRDAPEKILLQHKHVGDVLDGYDIVKNTRAKDSFR